MSFFGPKGTSKFENRYDSEVVKQSISKPTKTKTKRRDLEQGYLQRRGPSILRNKGGQTERFDSLSPNGTLKYRDYLDPFQKLKSETSSKMNNPTSPLKFRRMYGLIFGLQT